MNEMFFRIGGIQKKMEFNQNMRTIMKGTGFLIVFTIFFCSLNQPDTMKNAWILSILFIGLLFGIEFYYIKQNKKYEFKLFKLEIEDLENKKEIAKIRGDVIPDMVANREIIRPSNEISLPIVYYAILIILDIMIKVLMIN